MKRKEFIKRLMSITMAAMMTTTMVPTSAFAAEEDFFGDSAQIVSGISDEGDFSDGEAFTDDGAVDTYEEGTQDTLTDLFADKGSSEDAEGTEEDTAKAAAMEYLKTNYIKNNKFIGNGGNGVVKSDDGLACTVGLKNGTSSITSIRLKVESSTSTYKSGWYISDAGKQFLKVGTKKPSNLGSLGIDRPTADQGAQSFTVTLRLFSSDTPADVINDEAQAAEAALATQDFTITLEAAEPTYTMTVKVQDEDSSEITDATVTLEKGWSTVYPGTDGSYTMEKGAEYTLTVKKDGYNDYKESYFTFNPTELNTEKVITLRKIVNRNVKFVAVDKNTGKTIDDAKITVKQGYYTTIKPESDGSYNLVDGTSYNYTVEAQNYTTINGSLTPDKDDTITVEMVKNISKYAVNIKPVEEDGTTEIPNASVTVTYEEEDYWGDTETTTLTPNQDGSYTMDKGVEYTYTVKADGYKDVTGTYKPSGDEENITLPVTMVKDGVEITECKTTILPKDGEETISGAEIKVTYEAYDEYYQNPYTAELKANEDGTYTMKKGVEYTYTVKADGYEDATGTYTADGTKDADTISVAMTKKPVATEDQQTIDAIKAEFDAELGVLRPNFATDKNIIEMVKAKISAYTDIDTTGVTVSIKSTDDEKIVEKDGTIHYNTGSPNSVTGVNSTNVDIVYTFEKNGAKAETQSRRATICWDRDYYNQQMESEKDSLTWDKIKGSNTDATEVTSSCAPS